MPDLRFPPGFAWGAATAAYQVEGHAPGADWWSWERRPGAVRDGELCGQGADWWNGRAEEDLRLAASLGHNAHRMSLEWARLEPEPGVYDPTAFDRYADILDAGREAGLRMMVTIHHFTLPWWASPKGWTDGTLVERFARLCAKVVRHLGERVDTWATINEPGVLAHGGYAGKRWPPGHGSVRSFMKALPNLLRAHAAGVQAIRRVSDRAKVGLVLAMPVYAPATDALEDRAAAAGHDWIFNGAMLFALERGVILPPLAARPVRVPGLTRSFDWLGLNYYGRYLVAFDPSAIGSALGRHVQLEGIKTPWNDWGEVYPDGLAHQLERLSRLGQPLYVTENGIFDPDDTKRPGYLLEHLRALHRAISHGADVRGYFHWTLVDNFEWAEGWSTPFGLVQLHRLSQRRTPRASARLYETICRANAIPEDIELPEPRPKLRVESGGG